MFWISLMRFAPLISRILVVISGATRSIREIQSVFYVAEGGKEENIFYKVRARLYHFATLILYLFFGALTKEPGISKVEIQIFLLRRRHERPKPDYAAPFQN